MKLSEPVCVAIVFSDLVIREHGTGKLSLIGTFTHFNAAKLPFVIPQFCITSLVTNVDARAFPLNFAVQIEDPDGEGRILARAGGRIDLRPDAPHQRDDIVELPIQLVNCTFPQTGTYRVSILVDDECIGFRPLKLRDPPKPPQ